MKTAIKLQFGFSQKLEPGESIGFYALYHKLAQRFYDRRETWLGMREWNEPGERSANVILDFKPDCIIDINFSWANGYGLPRYAKALEEWDREIDLLIMVDPVLYTFGRWATRALWRSDKPFVIPPNVKQAKVIQTVNRESWTSPWGGRRIETSSPKTVLDEVFVFGSRENLMQYGKHATRAIIDPAVFHGNIDQDARTHTMILDWIVKEIKS